MSFESKAGRNMSAVYNAAIETVIDTIPTIIIASMTGGMGAIPKAAGDFGKITAMFKKLAINPIFWTNSVKYTGDAYHNALDDGATEEEAMQAAAYTGVINSAIECMGFENELLKSVQDKKFWDELGNILQKTALTEGLEQAFQGNVSALINKQLT